MSRMFTVAGKPMVTWNPFTGCLYSCAYCWAKPLAERLAAKPSSKYGGGFRPAFHYAELKHKFKPGQFCFVSDMGDLSFIEEAEFCLVRHIIMDNPDTDFLLCTKGPAWYARHFPYPQNVFLGTTIETNRDYTLTRAPLPALRYMAMRDLDWPKKFISIEPIMDFDVYPLLKWVEKIKPRIVEVGADNHKKRLPEPEWSKVEQLLAGLRGFVPVVEEKQGLERLRLQ